MATYQIEWKKSAIRELKRLDRAIIPRIIEAVDNLSSNLYHKVSPNYKAVTELTEYVSGIIA